MFILKCCLFVVIVSRVQLQTKRRDSISRCTELFSLSYYAEFYNHRPSSDRHCSSSSFPRRSLELTCIYCLTCCISVDLLLCESLWTNADRHLYLTVLYEYITAVQHCLVRRPCYVTSQHNTHESLQQNAVHPCRTSFSVNLVENTIGVYSDVTQNTAVHDWCINWSIAGKLCMYKL